MFDCQSNTFAPATGAESDSSELDMGIFFRVLRPDSSGGGYWVRCSGSELKHKIADEKRTTLLEEYNIEKICVCHFSNFFLTSAISALSAFEHT